MPSISIITPVYNNRTWIAACIKNIIEQQCPAVEHIIVDGGSSDGTVDIIQQHAQAHEHIRWVSERDQGQSDAMNKGISMAKGEFIGFLNVDDEYDPGVLNRIYQIITTDHFPFPAMLLGNLRQLDNDGKIRHVRRPNPVSLFNVLQFWEFESYPANPVSYFYHKRLHDIIGEFDIHQHYTMDYDFFLKASPVVHVKYYDEIWGVYRMIEGAKTVEILKKGGTKHIKEKLFFKYLPSLPFRKRLLLLGKFLTRYKISVWKKTLWYYYHACKSIIKKFSRLNSFIKAL